MRRSPPQKQEDFQFYFLLFFVSCVSLLSLFYVCVCVSVGYRFYLVLTCIPFRIFVLFFPFYFSSFRVRNGWGLMSRLFILLFFVLFMVLGDGKVYKRQTPVNLITHAVGTICNFASLRGVTHSSLNVRRRTSTFRGHRRRRRAHPSSQ